MGRLTSLNDIDNPGNFFDCTIVMFSGLGGKAPSATSATLLNAAIERCISILVCAIWRMKKSLENDDQNPELIDGMLVERCVLDQNLSFFAPKAYRRCLSADARLVQPLRFMITCDRPCFRS